MKIKQLLTLIRRDYGPDVTLTPELGEEIASFVRGQAEPHAVLRYNDCGVLCCAVTGEHEATFPVHKLSGYDTEIESLKAACLWAESCGALTYEWLGNEVPTSGHTEMVRKCDVPTCKTMVRERNAHYTDDTRWRMCRFHAEMLDADDLARLVDEDLATVTHVKLDRHSPLWQVVACLRDAVENGDRDIYSGDCDGTHISHEEVEIVIKHLTHGNEWSAIQYSDAMDMGIIVGGFKS